MLHFCQRKRKSRSGTEGDGQSRRERERDSQGQNGTSREGTWEATGRVGGEISRSVEVGGPRESSQASPSLTKTQGLSRTQGQLKQPQPSRLSSLSTTSDLGLAGPWGWGRERKDNVSCELLRFPLTCLRGQSSSNVACCMSGLVHLLTALAAHPLPAHILYPGLSALPKPHPTSGPMRGLFPLPRML